MSRPALRVYAGARAQRLLRERGLRAQDVRLLPAAAGGPKGLILNPLDKFLFGEWLPGSGHEVHLLGGVHWRLAHGHGLPGARWEFDGNGF